MLLLLLLLSLLLLYHSESIIVYDNINFHFSGVSQGLKPGKTCKTSMPNVNCEQRATKARFNFIECVVGRTFSLKTVRRNVKKCRFYLLRFLDSQMNYHYA